LWGGSGRGWRAQSEIARPLVRARERDHRGSRASRSRRRPRLEPDMTRPGRALRRRWRGLGAARGLGDGRLYRGENDSLRPSCAAPAARCQRRGAARASALWRCHGHRPGFRLRHIGHGSPGGAPQTHPRRQLQEQRQHRLPRLMQRTTRTVGLHCTMSDIGWWRVKACRKSAFKSAG
jgi:hypothetical protein